MRFTKYLFGAMGGLFLALALVPGAEASPITYAFSVTATTGPLAGITSAGTFAYDSSSIVPNGLVTATGLLTALDFTWDGTTYDQTTANTGDLRFDGSGNLLWAVFGNHCGAGSCNLSGPGSWEFDAGGFVYTPSGTYPVPVYSGTNTLTQTPEPATLVLLSVGLAGLAFRRSRRGRKGLKDQHFV